MNDNVIKEELTNKITDVNCFYITDEDIGYSDRYSMSKKIAEHLYEAGYRKQSETVKEFAEQLKKELFVNCVVIQTISNPQKEDMDSSEAFQIINDLAEQYGKEIKNEKE